MLKKGLVILLLLTVVGATSLFAGGQEEVGGKKVIPTEPGEVYYMVSFLSGADFWKGCYLGMKEMGDYYGVETFYAGTPEYDITKAVTVFEQIVAKKPTGIAVTCMNPEPFIDPINKAIDMGIKVITFDTDSPQSRRSVFVSTDNRDAGREAARFLAKAMNKRGKIGVLVRPAQLNVWVRYLGFKEVLESEYPNMKIVQLVESQGTEQSAAESTAAMIQANPDLDAIFSAQGIEAIGATTAVVESGKDIRVLAFDTPAALLDQIKNGEAWATGVQNTYMMGYFSMICLYHEQHNLPNPLNDWKINQNVHPLPAFINTGITFATKDNVDHYKLRDLDKIKK